MKTTEQVLLEISTVQVTELQAWVAADWVRPDRAGDELRFSDTDVARVRLVHELRHDLAIDDETIPLLLSLMDQLYDARYRLRALLESLQEERPEVRRRVLARYARTLGAGGA